VSKRAMGGEIEGTKGLQEGGPGKEGNMMGGRGRLEGREDV
jgi:hypothetical protein